MTAYCNNNPNIYCDPTGHILWEILGLIAVIGCIITLSGSSPIGNNPHIQSSRSDDNINYGGHTNNRVNPQIPPNSESGYKAPKGNPNPQPVREPNGPKKGWPSEDGGVWVPNNKMHGGSGWTVQYPGGRHEHRYPDGNVRRFSSVLTYSNEKNTTAAVILLIFLIFDDATGMGASDDILVPVVVERIISGG